MQLSWSNIAGLFIAIVLAGIALDYYKKRQDATAPAMATVAEVKAVSAPRTVDDYVALKYPNAYNN